MEVDTGGDIVQAVTIKDWKNATLATLDSTKDRADKLAFTLRALEQQEADRLAAHRAERQRQALQAAAAQRKLNEEKAAEHEKRLKEVQSQELRRQQELLSQRKETERAELLAATANFKKMRQAENDAREKERVMNDLTDSLKQVGEGVLECQHLTSKLWGALMLCEQRQKVRQGRPHTELFKDYADEALQREWQMLTESRRELNVLVTNGEALQSELQKRHAQLKNEQSREKKCSLTKSSSLPTFVQPVDATSSKDLLMKAIAAIDKAVELPTLCASTRSKVISQCDLAMADVHTSLDQRKLELGELIRGLQGRKADAEKTIGDAQRRIVRLRRHGQSTMETPRSSKATDDQLYAAESLLSGLMELSNTLETDLSNKYRALKIDESCRQFTKIRSGGHKSKTCQTMRKIVGTGAPMRKTAKDCKMPRMPPAG
jgi:hypothetical protein